MSRHDMIKGIIPPIITPMNEDESFNEAEFRNQIERQIEGGVHGIFCYGTNGECYALNTQEKEEILKVAVDQIKGRVPVYAGTGCITTKETVEMSKRAEALGADILSVITPYFAAVPRTSYMSTTKQLLRQLRSRSFFTTFLPEQDALLHLRL